MHALGENTNGSFRGLILNHRGGEKDLDVFKREVRLGCDCAEQKTRSGAAMIRECDRHEFVIIYEIINEAAQAYKSVIPSDRWRDPYMSKEELQAEIDAGVVFWGYELDGTLAGVMGIQGVRGVILIRHAYVRPGYQRQGIGSALLTHLRSQTDRPILIGTWAAASWAIQFYETHGFRVVPSVKKDELLRTYWSIPARQVETSVVLADDRWFQTREQDI